METKTSVRSFKYQAQNENHHHHHQHHPPFTFHQTFLVHATFRILPSLSNLKMATDLERKLVALTYDYLLIKDKSYADVFKSKFNAVSKLDYPNMHLFRTAARCLNPAPPVSVFMLRFTNHTNMATNHVCFQIVCGQNEIAHRLIETHGE